jgi:hypothetical protein
LPATGQGYRLRMNVDEPLDEHGRSYAQDAGVAPRDESAPLFQLLGLTLPSSVRTRAGIATPAARELLCAGWPMPARMRRSSRQERVGALGRAYFDKRAQDARSLGLATDDEKPAAHVVPGRVAGLAAAGTRSSLDRSR